jgi:HPt (histidine-containing phosphotransfer) domain-containing protein
MREILQQFVERLKAQKNQPRINADDADKNNKKLKVRSKKVIRF